MEGLVRGGVGRGRAEAAGTVSLVAVVRRLFRGCGPVSGGVAEAVEAGRSKREAMAWYDRLCGWYDPVVWWFGREARTRGMGVLDVQPGERVVEIGPGPGRSLVAFAGGVGTGGCAVGVDISREMCRAARDQAANVGAGDRVGVVQGDGEHLPLGHGVFDAGFMSFTLELFDPPAISRVLGECRRVLRADGRLVIVGLSKRGPRVATRAYERVHAAFPRYVDCRPVYVADEVRRAGFVVVATEVVPVWGLRAEVVRAEPEE